jgi:hypothetical protein
VVSRDAHLQTVITTFEVTLGVCQTWCVRKLCSRCDRKPWWRRCIASRPRGRIGERKRQQPRLSEAAAKVKQDACAEERREVPELVAAEDEVAGKEL